MTRFESIRRLRPLGPATATILTLLGVLGCVAAVPSTLAAQATAVGQIDGVVTDAFGAPVVNALVMLARDGQQVGGERGTGRSGRFTIPGLAPGRYDVRVEALGYHPVIVRGVALRPGTQLGLPVTLRRGTPPITVVDTVAGAPGSLQSDRWLETLEFTAPANSRELREVLELVTTMDGRMGATGLPSGFTTVTVQGLPFRGAAVAAGHQDPSTALSAGSTGLMRVGMPGASHDFGLGAGGAVEVFNPFLQPGRSDLFAAGSIEPLWAGRYETGEGLTPSSFWLQGRSRLGLVGDSIQILVGADMHHMERPRQPLFPFGTRFSEPGLEDSEVVTAFVLTDWVVGEGSRLDLGVRLGSRPAANSVTRLAYPGMRSAREARDIVLGGGFASQLGERGSLGIRIGFTRSERSGTGEAWPLDEDAPALLQLSSGRRGGVDPTATVESLRQGIFGSASAGIQVSDHLLEGGIEILRSRHDIQPLGPSMLWVGSGDPFADGWQGAATRFQNARSSRDFSVTNFALFVRDTWRPAPGVRIDVSGRWHQEEIPADDLEPDRTWSTVAGLDAASPNATASGLAGRLGIEWTRADGALHFQGSVGGALDETDPWLVAEALALDGTTERTRVVTGIGTAEAWPEFPESGLSTSAPSLTLFPTERVLPTTAYATAGVSTRQAGITLGLSGSFRRTENLYRRVDLNLATTASGITESGRSVWGSLVQRGGLVTEVPGSSRRFRTFDHVWSLLQDGWSQYVGLTASVERRDAGGIQVAAWYTYSRTTDNLPGLALGLPELAGTTGIPDEDRWSEGTSDLDIPHRIAGALAIPIPVLEGAALRGRLRVESGRPFTPGVRAGVDLNGDGIAGNDPVFVRAETIEELDERWDCVRDSRDDFMERNACRRPWVPYLDLGLSVGLLELGGSVISLRVDAFDILQAFDIQTNDALFLVSADDDLQPDGTTVAPAFRLNRGLGHSPADTREGRMIRFGISWGGGR